jgi:hypothetical protein
MNSKKVMEIKVKPKTIKRNELHFKTQLTTRGAIHEDKTKYNRKKIKGENNEY